MRASLAAGFVLLVACGGGGDAASDGGTDAEVDANVSALPLCVPPERVPAPAPVATFTGLPPSDFDGTFALTDSRGLHFSTATLGDVVIDVTFGSMTYDVPVHNAFAALPIGTPMHVSITQGLELTDTTGALVLAIIDVASTSATAGTIHFAQSPDVDCVTVACGAGGGAGCATGCYQGYVRTRVAADGGGAPIAQTRTGAVGAYQVTVVRSVAQAGAPQVRVQLADPTHAICADPLSSELALLVLP